MKINISRTDIKDIIKGTGLICMSIAKLIFYTWLAFCAYDWFVNRFDDYPVFVRNVMLLTAILMGVYLVFLINKHIILFQQYRDRRKGTDERKKLR